MPMNYVDLILVTIIAAAITYGWKRGFIDSLIDITIWLGSFVITLILSEYIIRIFNYFNISAIWVRPAYFIILLAGFSRIIFVICDHLSARVPRETHEHWSNKAAGLLPGLFSGTVYAALAALFLLSYSVGDFTVKAKTSQTAGLLTSRKSWPGKPIAGALDQIGYKLGNTVTVYPEGKELIRLPFKTTEFTHRPDLETRILDLINRERSAEGIKPLEPDPKLAVIARQHSADMLKRGYFAHYSPEGAGPFDRIRKGRIMYSIAGENLALARTLELAHEGLMASPNHKANILNPAFGRAGIGILDAGIHGIMITENFRN